MNFRSFADLSACVLRNLHKLDPDIDLVVGIPRSGLLPASLVALYRNIPMTDVEGFLAGRVFAHGISRAEFFHQPNDKPQKVLVLDDSIDSGRQIAKTRERLQEKTDCTVLYGAVYATPEGQPNVDIVFEVCPQPRLFEWNFMHHSMLKYSCIDIDGVLCRDPEEAENDDGVCYEEFLHSTDAFLLPKSPVGWLVTCRLEKYRRQTEDWLKRHNVQFEQLLMWDLPNKDARLRSGSHGKFKGAIYRDSGKRLFIESDEQQAKEIAQVSGKPVLCMANLRLIEPGSLSTAVATSMSLPLRARRHLGRRIKSLANNIGL